MKLMKKEWVQPDLQTLHIDMTAASANWGQYDEGFNQELGEEGQVGIHHGS